MSSDIVPNGYMNLTVEPDLSLRYLQAELVRMDVLIRRQVRLWQLAGQDPADIYRGLYVSDAEVNGMLNRVLGSNWGQTVELPVEELAAFTEAEAKTEAKVQAVVTAAQQHNLSLRLLTLASAFNLSRFELDVLLIALAPTLDLRYEKLYAYLQDDVTRKRPSVNLALDLLGETGPARLRRLASLAEESPLRKYQLLDLVTEPRPAHGPLLSQTLRVDETVVNWLLGHYRPHPDLGAQARLLHPTPDPSDPLLAGDALITLSTAKSFLDHAAPEQPLLVCCGPDEVSQQAAARFLAAQLQRPLLEVDLAALSAADSLPLQAVTAALRDARLTGAVLCLSGFDTCLTHDGQPPRDLFNALCTHPDLVILAGQKRWPAQGNETQRLIYWLDFPVPNYVQRLKLWHYFLTGDERHQPKHDHFPTFQLSNLPTSALAGQFALTTGQIRDAVAAARGLAAQRGEALGEQDLFQAARAHSNLRLEALARKIPPRYGWADLILPEDHLTMLAEIVETVRGRPVVLEAWGVGRKLASSAAVTILFAGEPGTGKTMAAEVMANELKLDLYKIDLSTVVSKYIGETEKNLEKIFSEAESSNAILFFDEADAIFGKRSEVKDAHDRYANIEISYLLQRMESYHGVTILATNLRANLDEAFTRRLHFVVDFPFPEAADRLRIWQTLFPPDVPRAPGLDFAPLAERFKLTGGNIRNVIVNAAYQAAANGGMVTMGHLRHGLRRELQKMGRLVGEGELNFGNRHQP